MGVLTDFFIATESQLSGFDPRELPSECFDTFQAKGVDSVKVDLLYATLTGQPFADVVNCGELAGEPEEEGPWTFKLPSLLLRKLAALGATDIPPTAAKWSESEDFEGWTAADVELVLENLAALARRATPGAELYHWISL